MLPAMVDLLRKEPKLRVVYKDIPILGPGSAVGARAALAAGKQGAYLKMREAMMTGPSDITAETVKSASARLGLDWERLQRDMADPALQARIDENLKLARQLGIQGTPAYVIGDQLLPGAVTVAELQTAIAQVRKR
jgi:protein-disulfide isomerase